MLTWFGGIVNVVVRIRNHKAAGAGATITLTDAGQTQET